MRKIKVLFAITLFVIILFLIHFGTSIHIAEAYINQSKATEDDVIFGKYNMIIGFLVTGLIFIGLCISLKCILGILRSGFFTETSRKLMRWAGYIYLLSGISNATFDIIALINGGEEATKIGFILLDSLLAILGLIVLIVADMAQTGYQLKSENDLTI
ncbi:DUF2975 domain-containing protein [uncultured Dokdonia sp.]|uniref:DUF2975 domain-containing protein n=1 Tax=Dokdonia sp. R78006 TaxID=3093866 RepID=UPI0026211658|nr:DUF2975 domain-containing protein [uncultured Dokdonia sp.]